LKKLLEFLFENSRVEPTVDPLRLGIQYQDVEFSSGGRVLKGWLIEGKGPTLIMTHGWGANTQVFIPLIHQLAPSGYRILAFDVSNHGRSQDYHPTTIRTFVEDIHSAIKFMGNNPVLIGHSMGAASSIIAGNREENVRAIVAIAPFCSTKEIISRRMGTLVPNSLKRKVLEELEKIAEVNLNDFSPCNFICRRRLPVLLLHGELDETVPPEDSLRIKERCPDVDVETIPDEDHMSILTNKDALRRIEKFLEQLTG